MRRLIKNTGKNYFLILIMAIVAVMLYVTTNINAQPATVTVVNVKAAFEGLYDESNGYLTKEADVDLYLRNTEPPYKIVDVAKGVINKITLEGEFTFDYLNTGRYYLVLKSKNTIETWSRSGGEFIVSNSQTSYDFTSGKEMAYGDNMVLMGKLACIFTGDINQNGFIDNYDLNTLIESIGKQGEDIITDLNGDGIVDKSDLAFVRGNLKKETKLVRPIDVPSEFAVEIKAVFEGLFNYDATDAKDANVTVFLRNIYPPYEIAGKSGGIINKCTHKGIFIFPEIQTGKYYIVLKSKNTIETWSRKEGEEIVMGKKLSYDFTTGMRKAFGDNMLMIGKYAAIYTGDVDQNGIIDKSDVGAVLDDAVKNTKGDVVTDLNGDEIVNELDYAIVNANFEKNIKSVTPMDYTNSLTLKDASRESFTLKQNSPNPFNPSTKIALYLLNTSNVMLNVYDMSGRLVEQLVNTVLTPGDYIFNWNAGNFASGTYFYRLNVNGNEQTMKMQLIK